MTPETRIARHYLGDSLLRVEENLWSKHWNVFFGAGKVAIAPTVEEAARDAASQLRAQGWTPTHARLEWEPTGNGSVRLCLRLDKFTQVLFSALRWSSGRVSVYDMHTGLEENRVLDEVQAANAVAFMVGWCAANLPSIWLPPFPENPTVPPCTA